MLTKEILVEKVVAMMSRHIAVVEDNLPEILYSIEDIMEDRIELLALEYEIECKKRAEIKNSWEWIEAKWDEDYNNSVYQVYLDMNEDLIDYAHDYWMIEHEWLAKKEMIETLQILANEARQKWGTLTCECSKVTTAFFRKYKLSPLAQTIFWSEFHNDYTSIKYLK